MARRDDAIGIGGDVAVAAAAAGGRRAVQEHDHGVLGEGGGRANRVLIRNLAADGGQWGRGTRRRGFVEGVLGSCPHGAAPTTAPASVSPISRFKT